MACKTKTWQKKLRPVPPPRDETTGCHQITKIPLGFHLKVAPRLSFRLQQ